TGANWAGGAAPTSANTVIIDGNYTNAPILDLTSGTTTIKGLSLGENNASVLTLSNGNATTNKLVVTGDVDIGANGTLSHTANTTAQTHTINLEAVNFSIASGGTIDVTQKGYNPCVGPGAASSTNSAGGAAYGGNGGDGALSVGGSSYGSISQPASIGSGGGQSTRGGSGGGAVKLVVSNTTTINGNISANGQGGINDYGGGGSGGAVWIDTGTLSGAGMVITNGGNGYNTNEGGGGGGRIAVYYTIDSSTVSYQAYGGLEGTLTTRMGGAGTIYKKSAAQTNGDLTIDNNDQDNWDDGYIGRTLINETITFDTITIQNYGNLETGSSSNITYTTVNWSTKGIITDNGGTFALLSGGGNLTIPATAKLVANTARTFTGLTVNGTLTHTNNPIAETYKLDYTINGDATIASGGAINANVKGYSGGYGPGTAGDGYYVGGAGYGGDGGDGASTLGGLSYGSITEPINIGSGGGSFNGGVGAGAIKINISGITTIDGIISANGGNGFAASWTGGGGSGGSIYITTGTLAGSSTISANGGNSYREHTGGGGGGRIAIYYTTDNSSIAYTAYGGNGSGIDRVGGAGTIYKKSAAQTNGDLTIDNNDQDHADETYMGKSPLIADWTFDNVTISGAGKLDANGYNLTINADFNNAGTFTHSNQTVVFGDNSQVSHIYGDTTFNNFICTAAGKVLQFAATKTQIITGTLTLIGQSGSLITLRSTSDGTQWNIDPQGTRSVDYVDVKDSNNVNATAIRAFYPVDSLNNINWDWMSVGLAEFVSIVDPDDAAGTDYTSLSSWESNNQADLTAVTTMVFSHAGITGAISDTDSVTGVTSGATADVVHATATQILLENISGTFESGEQVYQTQDTNYVTISNDGDMAISVASCRSSAGTADQTAVSIDGWTTNATNYIKVYTPQENRHSGIWNDSVYRLSLTAGANDTHLLDIKENYVKVEGLQISLTNSGGYTGCKAVNMDSQVTTSVIDLNSNILKGAISEANSEGTGIYANSADTIAKIYNNIIYDFINGAVPNTAGITTATGGTYYLYNNSLIDNYLGIDIAAGTAVAKNNIVKGSGDTNAYLGTFASGTDYNATDGTDDIGKGTNNKTEQAFSFINEAANDFHLVLTDVGAKDSGTDLSADANISFSDDIDSETRFDTWDIGVDEEMTAIWDGSESTDWAAGANWQGGAAPTPDSDVIIDGNYTNAPTLDLTSGTTTVNSLSLGANNASALTLSNGNSITNKLVVIEDVDVGANGTLTHTANATEETHTINIEAANFSIADGGTINADFKGYQLSEGPGQGYGVYGGGGSSGAGYGGEGGAGASGEAGGLAYGAI
ncbi:MAG: hypothetical protein KAI72_10900, partial [Candidatus Pacebacteria bacterium]|nr:hypothetical protein [Candidatus Paceibacterota bacterium]